MIGINLRTLMAAALIALAASGVRAPVQAQAANAQASSAQAGDAGVRFDAIVADAKATMLIDPGQTIVKAQAAERAAQELTGRQRTIGIATGQWLQGEAYLRINDEKHAKLLIDKALRRGFDGRSADQAQWRPAAVSRRAAPP